MSKDLTPQDSAGGTSKGQVSTGQTPIRRTGGRLKKSQRLDTRQSRYLAYSVVLEEAGGPRLMRLAMVTITLVVAAFVAWTWITPIREVSTSFGQVIPGSSIQTVQHLEGGIIKEILAEEGLIVEQGDVLMRLEPAGAQSELAQTIARQNTLMLQMERLRAFAEDRDPDFSMIDGLQDVKNDQLSILTQERASLDSQRAVLDSQYAQKQEEIVLFNQQENGVLEDISLMEEELALRQGLFDKGLDSRIRVLAAQREVNNARSALTQLRGDRSRAREALLEIDQRIVELEDRTRQTALTELGSLGTELSQVRENLTRLEDRVRRLDVVAPATGRVNNMVLTTIGGVVAPGAPVMEIVPVNTELLVETKISTRDIGHLSVGQDVTVKVVTYDFARYGGIEGTLANISPTTFTEDSEEPYYRGRVELAQNFVGNDPRANIIAPGMTVQADITTGEKTLFQYLMKPIYTTFTESFTER